MDMEELKSADIITAGFPCQDISLAGKGAGLAGERSGLWWQVRRTLRMVRPRYALLENVAALLNRGLSTVLGSLASIGYDTEWHCIPASYVGAPHRRDRIWIICHTNHNGSSGPSLGRSPTTPCHSSSEGKSPAGELEGASRPERFREVANTESERKHREHGKYFIEKEKDGFRKLKSNSSSEVLAYTKGSERGARKEQKQYKGNTSGQSTSNSSKLVDPISKRRRRGKGDREDATDVNPPSETLGYGDNGTGGAIKSFMGGMAYGIPEGLDEHFRVDPADSGITPRVTKDKKIVRAPRLKSLGNAIVKQMATFLGHAIADYNDELNVPKS